MTTQKSKPQPPAFTAWYVPERDGAPWTRIGAAWAHKDGNGFNLALELIPTGGGRITLRKFEPKETTEGAEA